jgi:hypothetical protein
MLRFRDFSNIEERIVHGRQAFAIGAAIGWPAVEASLRRYAILSPAFFQDSAEHFDRLRKAALA